MAAIGRGGQLWRGKELDKREERGVREEDYSRLVVILVSCVDCRPCIEMWWWGL